jgi:2-dehydropantoate 2-reductase
MADAGPLLGPETDVLTLQNGLGNAETIAEYVPPRRVLVGVTTHGAVLEAPGVVRHTGAGDTALGRFRGPTDERARAVATRLTAAGLATDVVDDPETLVWEKVLVNVGINAPTALARVDNGTLVESDAGRSLLRAAVGEAERVARACGHDVRDDIAAYARRVAERTASNRSSMRVDLESGRRTEVEALYGAVLERAEDAGIDAPVVRTLAELVRLAEGARADR